MARNKLRKINVNNEPYLWKREHFHLTDFKYSKCAEKVVIYLEGYKNSPLQLLFREEDNLIRKTNIHKEKWCVGYPDDGVIWLYKPTKDLKPQTDHVLINLNRPAVIATLIEHYLQNGWQPQYAKSAFIIEDALQLMDTLNFPKGINKPSDGQ